MAPEGKPLVIALEEHYYDPEVAKTFDGPEGRAPEIRRRLDDLGELRLKEMDEAGIDVQVLSHGAPSTQRLDAPTAVRLARDANDRLAKVIAARPERFAGFAALPTPDPKAAAAELDRTISELGFKGAMVHGLTNGVFFDDKRFWPIFERAQALDVPLYVHPAAPHSAVVDAYYKDYVKDFPAILNAAWGFTVETATQGIRLVLSGVFDAYPDLKIILGQQSSNRVPRAVQPALLHHDQRELLNAGVALLDDGARRRPDPLLGRLAIRAERAGNEVDERAAALGRGQDQDLERERQATTEDVRTASTVEATAT